MSNLLEQWNDHIIKGNQLSRELEALESIMGAANMENRVVAIYGAGETTFLGGILAPEKMQELKDSVVAAINQTRDDKVKELEKLMGIRKPAIVNPDFEAAVQSMVDSVKKPDPIEETLKEVLQEEAARIEKPKESDSPLFRDPGKDKPVKDDKSLDKYPAKKSPRKQYPDGMTVETVSRMFIDEGKTSSSIAKYFGISTKEVQNFMTINKIRREPKQTSKEVPPPRPTKEFAGVMNKREFIKAMMQGR